MSRHIKCSPGCCTSNPIVIGDCDCDSHLRLRTVDRSAVMPLESDAGSSDELNVNLLDLRGSVAQALNNTPRRRKSSRRRTKAVSKGFAFGALTMITVFIVVRVFNLLGELLLYSVILRIVYCLL